MSTNGDAVLDLGGPPLTGGWAGIATSFDASGQHRWQSADLPFVADAQLAPSGDLVVLGESDGVGHPLQRFDKSGAASAPIVIAGPPAHVSLAVGPNDEALIVGAIYPPGVGPFATAVAASGEVLWTRNATTSGENKNYRVSATFSPSGTPLLAGGFVGTMDLGTGPISAGKWSDVFVAALPP